MRKGQFVVGASHYDCERQLMQDPDDVAVILQLHKKGWGSKRIARELEVSKNTVKWYLRAGGYMPYGRPEGREKKLDGLENWVKQRDTSETTVALAFLVMNLDTLLRHLFLTLVRMSI